MNSKQKAVLGLACALVAIMVLFPPWIAHLRIPPSCDVRVSAGYAPIFLPPSSTEVRLDESLQRAGCPVTASFEVVEAEVELDLKRWLLSLVAVMAIAATAFFAVSDSTTLPGRK